MAAFHLTSTTAARSDSGPTSLAGDRPSVQGGSIQNQAHPAAHMTGRGGTWSALAQLTAVGRKRVPRWVLFFRFLVRRYERAGRPRH